MSKHKKQKAKARPRAVEAAVGFTVKFRVMEEGFAQAGLFLDDEPEPELTIGVLGSLDRARKDQIADAMLELLGLCLGETCCQITHQGDGAAEGLH